MEGGDQGKGNVLTEKDSAGGVPTRGDVPIYTVAGFSAELRQREIISGLVRHEIASANSEEATVVHVKVGHAIILY